MTDGPDGTFRGWLNKLGDDKMSKKLKKYKKRYFVLDGPKMRYFTAVNASGGPAGDMKGTIDISSMTGFKRDGENMWLSTLVDGQERDWHLKAIDAVEGQKWHTEIRNAGRSANAPLYAEKSTSAASSARAAGGPATSGQGIGRHDGEERGGYGSGSGAGSAGAQDHGHWDDSFDEAQQQQQQEQMRPQDINEEIAEREDAMIKIESTMTEVNSIYRDLAGLVHEQGDMLNSIEANIDLTSDRVDAGNNDLVGAFVSDAQVAVMETLASVHQPCSVIGLSFT
eukprot:m.248963 g.248963  ORF g.248963 m.248963 type:complete len:282 (+) comp19510_c0_seq3:173-1018(+)